VSADRGLPVRVVRGSAGDKAHSPSSVTASSGTSHPLTPTGRPSEVTGAHRLTSACERPMDPDPAPACRHTQSAGRGSA
jgi:hypothetical protein